MIMKSIKKRFVISFKNVSEFRLLSAFLKILVRSQYWLCSTSCTTLFETIVSEGSGLVESERAPTLFSYLLGMKVTILLLGYYLLIANLS